MAAELRSDLLYIPVFPYTPNENPFERDATENGHVGYTVDDFYPYFFFPFSFYFGASRWREQSIIFTYDEIILITSPKHNVFIRHVTDRNN